VCLQLFTRSSVMFSTTLALLSQIEHEKAYLCTLARLYELAGQRANVPGKPPFFRAFQCKLVVAGVQV
jgi:hypothetical protein